MAARRKRSAIAELLRIVKSSTHEREGWNTIELIVRGSEGSEHIVNGKTVFRAKELAELGPSRCRRL